MRFRISALCDKIRRTHVKSAGIITARLGSRLLVARCDAGQLPPLYTEVADSTNRPVGRIVDLYGSVGKPYVTIFCAENVPADVGTEVYVVAGSKPEHEKKYHRRKRNLR